MRELIRNIQYYDKTPVSNDDSHRHSGYQFIFITQGEVNLSINDTDYRVIAPSIILFNELDSHNVKSGSDNCTRYIFYMDTVLADQFLDKNLISMLKYRPLNYTNIFRLNQMEKSVFLGIFKTLAIEYAEEKSCGDIAVKNLISLMLVSLYRIYSEKSTEILPERILSVQAFIENHHTEQINIETLSKKMFLSRSYLTHEFKKNTGYSIQEYIRILRLNHAEELLTGSHYSIKQIAEYCGYIDVNIFNRHFKSEFNNSPLQYRKVFFQRSE